MCGYLNETAAPTCIETQPPRLLACWVVGGALALPGGSQEELELCVCCMAEIVLQLLQKVEELQKVRMLQRRDLAGLLRPLTCFVARVHQHHGTHFSLPPPVSPHLRHISMHIACLNALKVKRRNQVTVLSAPGSAVGLLQ